MPIKIYARSCGLITEYMDGDWINNLSKFFNSLYMLGSCGAAINSTDTHIKTSSPMSYRDLFTVKKVKVLIACLMLCNLINKLYFLSLYRLMLPYLSVACRSSI